MIKLHQYPGIYNLPSLSPFCIKVETYLKLCRIPFQSVVEINPHRGPKGKMPYLEDQGRTVSDSSLIFSYLKENYGDTLDCHLRAEQHAIGLCVQRLCEDHLYWVFVYARWVDTAGFSATRRNFSKLFPMGAGSIILMILRRRLIRQGHAQGMLRHSADEIYELGKQDLSAISSILGRARTESPFLSEGRPSSYDVCLFAFLSVICSEPTDTPLRRVAWNYPIIQDYIDQIKKKTDERTFA